MRERGRMKFRLTVLFLVLVQHAYADDSWRIETNQNGKPFVRVIDQPRLDGLLRSKWEAMKEALRTGDTAKASTYIIKRKQPLYKNVFDNLIVSFDEAAQYLGDIVWSKQNGPFVEYDAPNGSV